MSFDLDKINHPKVKFGKTGVLLVNLGTPDSTSWWDIRKYLKEFLSKGIKRTEEFLEIESASPYNPLTEITQHLLLAGGKRIRPVLVFLSAQFGKPDIDRLAKVAAAIADALEKRKSPAKIAFVLPNFAFADSTPRRKSASSITSS